MKKLFTFLMLGSFVFLLSCKDDEEPEPPHEVGEWNLEEFAFQNVPDAFARYEGATFPLNALGIESYRLNLFKGGSFTRSVKEAGRLSASDEGEWTLMDEEELILDSEEYGEEEYEVYSNKEDQLWIGNEEVFVLIPDTTIQRLANDYGSPGYQTYLDTVNDETYSSLLKQVALDLIFVFERED